MYLLSPESWNYRHIPHHAQFCMMLVSRPRVSCMLGKHSANKAIDPTRFETRFHVVPDPPASPSPSAGIALISEETEEQKGYIVYLFLLSYIHPDDHVQVTITPSRLVSAPMFLNHGYCISVHFVPNWKVGTAFDISHLSMPPIFISSESPSCFQLLPCSSCCF